MEKEARKEEEKKAGSYKDPSTRGEYTKLYKNFGRDNKNKAIRRQL